MVLCPKCGKEIADDSIYCNYCGARARKAYLGGINKKHVMNVVSFLIPLGCMALNVGSLLSPWLVVTFLEDRKVQTIYVFEVFSFTKKLNGYLYQYFDLRVVAAPMILSLVILFASLYAFFKMESRYEGRILCGVGMIASAATIFFGMILFGLGCNMITHYPYNLETGFGPLLAAVSLGMATLGGFISWTPLLERLGA